MSESAGVASVWKRAHESYLEFCLIAYLLTAVSLLVDWHQTGSPFEMSMLGLPFALLAAILFIAALYRAWLLESEITERGNT